MGKKHKSRAPTPQQLEAWEKEQQKLAALEKQMDILDRQQKRSDQANKKGPNVLGIILFMAGVWGLYGLQRYYEHLNYHRFLVVLSAVLAASGFSYLVYCLISKRTYTANYYWRWFGGRGEWTYRDEDPFTYWLYMAFLLFFEAAMIYEFFHLVITGSA